MREIYITKKYIEKRINVIREYCRNQEQKEFLDRRYELIMAQDDRHRSAIKYLFAETIDIIRNSHNWRTNS